MTRLYPCPIPGYDGLKDDDSPVYFVELPDKWLGKHTIVKDAALDSADTQGFNNTYTTFAVSLALTDNFVLPGLEGKPETWDFGELDLELITWVNHVVWGSFNADFTLKKSYFLASLNGHLDKKTLTTLEKAFGGSNQIG